MARELLSVVGARRLTIPAFTDSFWYEADQLAAGEPGLRIGEVNPTVVEPNWYAYDRAASQPFLLEAGVSKTILFWLQSNPYFALATQTFMGVHEKQTQQTNSALTNNWRIHPETTNSRSLVFSVGTQNVVTSGNYWGNLNKRLVAFAFDHTVGTHGQIELFIDGVSITTGALSAAPPTLTDPEFSFGSADINLQTVLAVDGNTQAGSFYFSKLAAFGRVLTASELLTLFNAI